MESEITKEIFEEQLDALVESYSVKIKLLGTRTCLSLPKLNQDSNNKESSDETLASNDTLAISENEELIKIKNSMQGRIQGMLSQSDRVTLFRMKYITKLILHDNKFV